MKKIRLFVLLLMAFFMPLAMQAQETVEIGDSTGKSYYVPFNSLYNYSFTEQVFPADEIGMAGSITTVRFYLAQSYTDAQTDDITLYMKNVERSTFASTTDYEEVTAEDVVFAGQWTIPANYIGWIEIELDDAFDYDGESNLMIAMHEYSSGYSTRNFTYTSVTNAGFCFYSDSYNPDPYNLSSYSGSKTQRSYRNKIQLEIEPVGGVTCPKPTTITVGNITKNSANVTWESEGDLWNLQYKLASETNWTSVNGLTTASHTLTGLTPNKNYNVRVQNVCPDTTSGWRSANFTTRFAMPFLEEFPTTTIPQGWTRYSGLIANVLDGIAPTSTTSGWSVVASSNGVFDTHAKLNIYGTSCNYWMITPDFLMEDNVQLTFDLALTKSSGTQQAVDQTQQADDKFSVLVHNTDNDTWTELRRWANTTSAVYRYNDISNTGEEVTFDLSSFAGQNIAIAFYGESTVAGGDNNLHIDNVEVDYIPTCIRPKQLSITNITSTTADLSWVNENDGTPAGYIVKVIKDTVETIYPTTSNPYTIQNLEPATTYAVRVMTACSSTDSSSWSHEVIFTTECAAYATISETFEDYTSGIPTCWENVEPGTVAVQTSHVHQGTKSLKFSGVASRNIVALPALETTNGMMLSFYTQPESSTNSNCGSFDVGYITDLSDTSTFHALDTYSYNDAEFANSAWSSKEVILMNVPDHARLAFRHRANSTAWYWFVDDVNVTVAPTCRKPIHLTVIDSTITTTSATIAWTNQNDDDPMGWIISLNGVETTVTTNPYTFDNLNASTTYTLKVRAACTAEDTSAWSDEITFGTECGVIVVTDEDAFSEDFNSLTAGIPLCWDNTDGTTTTESYKWNYSATGATGACVRFNSYSNSNGNTNMLKTPVLDLTQMERIPQLSFKYKNPTGGDFSVYISTDGGATYTTALATGLVGAANWTTEEIDIRDLAAYDQVVIVFKGTSNYGSGDAYIYLDDVTVGAGPIPCAVPANVTIDENYVVRWEGNAPRYNVVVLVNGDTVVHGVSTTGIYTITSGLNNGDYAAVYVQAICAEDDLSAWSEPVYFTYVIEGVESYKLQANIFPNPTTGNIVVESNAIGADITVYDMFGKLMMTSKVTDIRTELDLSGIAPGVYMVRIANNSGITTVKVVKE